MPEQAASGYTPIRIGMLSLKDICPGIRQFFDSEADFLKYSPTRIVIRTYPMTGNYIVMEGSQELTSDPVEPQIVFGAKCDAVVDMSTGKITDYQGGSIDAFLEGTPVPPACYGDDGSLDISMLVTKDACYTYSEMLSGLRGAKLQDVKKLLAERYGISARKVETVPWFLSHLEAIEGILIDAEAE